MMLAIILYPLCSFSRTYEIGDEINGVSFTPQLTYKTTSTEWTDWNTFWFGGAITMYGVGDLGSTYLGINSGHAKEANPIWGNPPNYLLMGLSKILVLGCAYYYIEYILNPADRQTYRNWTYGSLTVLGGIVTGNNLMVAR